jgi:hypothetical protein
MALASIDQSPAHQLPSWSLPCADPEELALWYESATACAGMQRNDAPTAQVWCLDADISWCLAEKAAGRCTRPKALIWKRDNPTTDEDAKTKRCPRCERVLSSDEFGHSSQSKDGLDFWCRECRRANWRKHDATRTDSRRKKGTPIRKEGGT